jgi:superfamily I DNA/RNA helicase/RecB family exonuclease
MSEPIRLIWPTPPSCDFVADEAQRAVIDHRGGHLRVLAGPGTGKTSVIVAAVAARIAQGQPVGQMLVLTYGRMAAAEIRQRLAASCEAAPVATTFHALALRILQAAEPGLRLMGGPEQEAVLREIVGVSKHLPAVLEPARHSRGLADQFRAYIAAAQSRAQSPVGSGDDPLIAAAEAVYAEYLDVTGLAATIDYAELIRRATAVIADDPPESVRRLRTIFVDEYQDTDPAQVGFLRQLAAHGAHVIAVGDPDQAIYGFRGADAGGILRFPEEFSSPSCDTIALDRTRRFGSQIAEVAARVVPRNALGGVAARQVQAHRAPAADGPEGQVSLRIYESEAAQAEHLADLLRRVHAGASQALPGLRLDWSQMAVLVRSAARDLPVLLRAFNASGVPVEVVRDDLPVSKAPAVRPLLNAVKAAADIDGGLTGERAVDLLASPLCGLQPRQIGRLGRVLRRQAARVTTGAIPPSIELIAAALREPEGLAEVEQELALPAGELAQILHRAAALVDGGAAASEVLASLWEATDWPRRLRRDALSGGHRAREAHETLDAVMELFAQAEQMDSALERVGSVAAFLEQLDRQVIPSAPDEQRAWNRNAVRLLTAHRAKGSQWPLVVVAGVQQGLWPDLRPRPTLLSGGGDWREQQMLEERRLFFVACTRASEALVVTAANSSAEDGPKPSSFVALAAGSVNPVLVPGRPRRPLTPVGVVAGLRQVLLDPHASPAVKQAVYQRLLDLAQRTDASGRRVFPWADPQRWWGQRAWTVSERPWYPPDLPLTLSASAVEAYVQCPRRWFLERRAKASEAASTKMAFGTLVHLCAEAVASGQLQPDEQQIADLLDEVWEGIGYAPGWQDRYEREEAQKATRRLLTWMKHTPGEFLAAEVPFTAQIDLDDQETVTITGKADRLDEVDGQLVITDFKTGKPTTVKAGQEHIQLGLYRWAAQLGALGVPRQAIAQLLYVRHDPPARQASVGARVIEQTTADVPDWLGPVLEVAASGIRAEVAPARPGTQCRTCVVCSSCPADQQGTEVRP